MQDRQGFIWLGTSFGLKRYDGYEFRSYDALASDSERALSGPITSICEDSSGVLWLVIRSSGMASLDRRTNTVTYYRNDPLDPTSLSPQHISVLQIDARGRLWAISQTYQVHLYDRSHDRFIRYEPRRDLRPAAFTRSPFPRLNGGLLFSTSKGDLTFDLESRKFKSIPSVTNRLGRLSLIEQINDSLCLAISWLDVRDDHRWFVVNFHTRQVLKELAAPMRTPLRWSAAYTPHDFMLLSFQDGLYCLDPGSGVGNHISLDQLSDPQCVFVDRSKRVWVGAASGLYLFDGVIPSFYTYKMSPPHVEGDHHSVENLAVRGLHAQGSRLQAGDQLGNVYEWDPAKRDFRWTEQLHKVGAQLNTHSVHQIASDDRGRSLYTTNSGPLFIQDHSTAQARALTTDEATGYTVLEDHTSSLWIGMSNFDPNSPSYEKGLLRYDPASGVTRYYDLYLPGRTSRRVNYVFSLFEDRHHQLWIGSSAGLFKYDRERDTCVPVLHPRCDGTDHAPNNIWVIFEDSRNQLWLGSWGRGLHHFDRSTGTYTDLTMANGLPNNNIQSILEDESGYLWIGTSKGLSKLDPRTNVFTNFDIEDGLLDEEFHPKAATKLASGEMFFGGITGVTSFYPSQITRTLHEAPIALTSLRISGNEMGQLESGETLTLPYDSNDLVIEYAALDFTSNDRLRYDYMLVGMDDDWIHAGDRRTASYNNLPPGSYTLRIRASEGNASSRGRQLQIIVVVSPPYWETWWFRLLAAAVFLGIITFVVVRELRRQADQQMRLERAREHERMQLAGDIHDGPLQDLYATRFLLVDDSTPLAALLATVRSDLRSISSVLQPPKFQSGLSGEIEILVQAYRSRCPNIEFHVTSNCVEEKVPENVARNLFRIVRTALTNVEKHSRASTCEIAIDLIGATERPDGVRLRVVDNGIGFDAASGEDLGREHFGLFLMRCYAKEVHAALSITSVRDRGTSIDIQWNRKRIRLRRSHYTHVHQTPATE